MPSIIVGALLGIVVLYSILCILSQRTQDSREPPIIADSIPFLSPIFSMINQKTSFYSNLRKKHNLPIYTLRLPTVRVYVVNETGMISTLQRQWRKISFTPILAGSGTAVLGMSKAGSELLHKDMTSDSNSVVSSIPIMARVLAPGPSLDSMNRKAVDVMAASMKRLGANGTTTIKFWEWTHHEILMATTEAVYGPQNPYRDSAVEAAWNTFEPSYMGLALSPFKLITARKAYHAREFITAAWRKYVSNGGPKTASAFIDAIHTHNARHGFNAEDLARFEVGHSFAVIGTTAPTTWWLMYHIFSDAAVLAAIREELSTLVQELENGVRAIDIAAVRTACPILLSTFKETMRYRAIGTAVRVCLEDHLLDNRFLLKKGGVVIIPQVVHHTATSIWGDDVDKFDHMRFVQTPGRIRPNPVAFRAFGGGHNLCPGRHFSSTEILAFAALMVLQFDVVPMGGVWVEPTWKRTPMVSSFQIPDKDIEIEARPRDSCQWRILFSGSAHAMQIVSEDIKVE